MKASDIPTKFSIAFASSAGPSYIETIPQSPSPTPGKASFQQGFPPVTFEQIAAGGTPPWGADMNGLANIITLWQRAVQAGCAPLKYDSAFQTAIGGYPAGALVGSATIGNGHYWLSSADDNVTNPDSAGAGWISFPGKLIQLQENNYAVDAGPANQVQIELGIAPASWSEIVGAPIRFKAAHANTVNNPTISANGLTPITIINPDGSVLGIGQIIAGGIAEGFPRDDGFFQINTPTKSASASTWPIPGFIMPWPNETPPSGFLECNGQSLLIASYPNLWAVLGTRYGGDGVTTFRLPDIRGVFIRGWDHGRGLDVDAAYRTNSGNGTVGDHVGTWQQGGIGSFSASLTNVMLGYAAGMLNSFNFPAGSAGLSVDARAVFDYSVGQAQPPYSGSIVPASTMAPFPNPWNLPNPFFGLGKVSYIYSTQGDGIAWDVQVSSISGTIIGNAGDTRPVNIAMMWVIAY